MILFKFNQSSLESLNFYPPLDHSHLKIPLLIKNFQKSRPDILPKRVVIVRNQLERTIFQGSPPRLLSHATEFALVDSKFSALCNFVPLPTRGARTAGPLAFR